MDANFNSELEVNLPSQHDNTDGRTGRTYEDTHYDSDILSLTATRGHVQAFDEDVVGLTDVLEAGIAGTRRRYEVTRTGEREPIPYQLRAAIWLRDRGICQKCYTREPKPWELDHIIPWSAGGPDTSDNLRVLCEPCNQERSNYDDGTSFAKGLVTWWCHRCYVDPVQWDYSWPNGIYCPTHHARVGALVAMGCPVERIYHWQTESDETPTWHKRAPIEAFSVNAYCAHCRLPGLTDVTL